MLLPAAGLCAALVGGAGPGLTAAFALVTCAGAVAAVVVSGRRIRELRAALSAARREVASLAQDLLAAEEDERRRVARDLHDDVAQSLTAALSYLWLAEREAAVPDDGIRHRIGEARRLASATLARIRTLSQRLRPALLDDYGLAPSLEACARRVGTVHAVEIAFHADLAARLEPELETAIFRIGQGVLEALADVPTVRHLAVHLTTQGPEVVLAVGVDGPKPSAAFPAERLVAVQRRIRALGGTLAWDTARGIRVLARVPRCGAPA